MNYLNRRIRILALMKACCHLPLKVFGVTDDTVRRMEALCFFDEVVTRDLLFLSVHDAILFIKLETFSGSISDPMADKVCWD